MEGQAAENNRVLVVIRQPPEFKLEGEGSFSDWYAQYSNFATAMAIADADRFTSLITYLDTAAFTIANGLQLTDEQKADPEVFKPLLEAALKRESDKIPPMIALRYRTQKPTESLSQFARELGQIANKTDLDNEAKEMLLVDSFRTGVRDSALSVKLLEQRFDTLNLALESALDIERASRIRNFVHVSKPASSDDQADLEILVANDATTPAPEPQGMPQLPWGHVNATSNQNTGSVGAQAPLGNPGRDANNAINYLPQQALYQNQNYRRNDSYQSNNQHSYRRGPINHTDTRSCYYCGIRGHLIKVCRKRTRDEEQQASNQQQHFREGPGPRQ